MRYVLSGRLREPSGLSPAEYFALAVREWEVVLDWLHARKALGYGRLGGAGGAILVDAASEAEARALARSLPFAPYAEMWVTPAYSLADNTRAGVAENVELPVGVVEIERDRGRDRLRRGAADLRKLKLDPVRNINANTVLSPGRRASDRKAP